jgi:hypothetical protein
MPTPIIINGNRHATANIAMNVIITREVPRNTLKKNSKISYNILYAVEFIKIISRKTGVYLLDLLFERKNAYLL